MACSVAAGVFIFALWTQYRCAASALQPHFRYTFAIHLQYIRFVFVMSVILPQYIQYSLVIYTVRIYSRCSNSNRQNYSFLENSLCHPLLFVIHPQYIIDDYWSQSLLLAVYIGFWYSYKALIGNNNVIQDTWKMYAWHSLLDNCGISKIVYALRCHRMHNASRY